MSIRDMDKEAILPFVQELIEMGFKIFATPGTSTFLLENDLKAKSVLKISAGRPNVLDMMHDDELALIINTPSPGPSPKVDEIRMRAEAVLRGIPIITTVSGTAATIDGLKTILKSSGKIQIKTLQEYHRSIAN